MSMPWFRMYAEWASDPVVQSLSFDDQRHHAVLLCLKCAGTLDRNIAPAQRERIIVRGLGLDPVTASDVKRRLMEVGLVDMDWQPKGWEKRQYKADVSTNRVRKYRENNKSGNVSETINETARNGSGNAPDTEQIQNRTETTTGVSPTPVPGLDPAAWEQWIAYRKQIRRPLKPASIPAAQRKLAAYGSLQAAVVEQSIANGWQGLFDLKSNGGSHATRERADNSVPGRIRSANGIRR